MHLCLEEPRTLCTLVTPGTGHEHTTDKFPPLAPIGEGHLARPQLRGGGTVSGLAAPRERVVEALGHQGRAVRSCFPALLRASL